MPYFRPGTNDAHVWQWVNEINEYELPDAIDPKWVVLDIGGHIGAFAHACAARGARRVYCFEPHLDNFRVLVENLAGQADAVCATNCAIWRSDRELELVHTTLPAFDVGVDALNTGGISVYGQTNGQIRSAFALPLDHVLRQLGHVDLMKIDCEGAEFPILLTSRELARVERIIGEFHEQPQIPEMGRVGERAEYTVEMLEEYLLDRGFSVDVRRAARPIGHFAARRDQAGRDRFLRRNVAKTIGLLDGWCSEELAYAMVDAICERRPEVCVEIGVYGGRSLFSKALAAKHVGTGHVWGIDPWSATSAVEGVTEKVHADWWGDLDYERLYARCMQSLVDLKLADVCTIVRAPAQRCAGLFDRIDWLHIDGNHSELAATRDVQLYLPKVPVGGYVWFDDGYWPSAQPAVELLGRECRLVRRIGSCTLYEKLTAAKA